MTFFSHRIVSTCRSVNSGFCYFWFSLLGGPSTLDFVYFDSFHSDVCSHDKLLTKDRVYSWFCLIWILHTFGSVYLGGCPPGCLSTRNRSTWESGHMTFCPRRIVSTIDSVNSGFSLRFVRSTWGLFTCVFVYFDSIHSGVWPHDILPT